MNGHRWEDLVIRVSLWEQSALCTLLILIFSGSSCGRALQWLLQKPMSLLNCMHANSVGVWASLQYWGGRGIPSERHQASVHDGASWVSSAQIWKPLGRMDATKKTGSSIAVALRRQQRWCQLRDWSWFLLKAKAVFSSVLASLMTSARKRLYMMVVSVHPFLCCCWDDVESWQCCSKPHETLLLPSFVRNRLNVMTILIWMWTGI